MDNGVDPVEFGKVLGQMAAHADDIRELKEGQAEANRKLDKLLEYQSKQKGAVSVLLLISTAVSGIVGWVISWITRH